MNKIIANSLNVDQDSIRDEMHFVNDLGADSLHIVEIVMEIEDEYNISIPDEDVETLETVGDLRRYLES